MRHIYIYIYIYIYDISSLRVNKWLYIAVFKTVLKHTKEYQRSDLEIVYCSTSKVNGFNVCTLI